MRTPRLWPFWIQVSASEQDDGFSDCQPFWIGILPLRGMSAQPRPVARWASSNRGCSVARFFEASSTPRLLAQLAAQVIGQQTKGLGSLAQMVGRPQPAACQERRRRAHVAAPDSFRKARLGSAQKSGGSPGGEWQRKRASIDGVHGTASA